MFIIDSFHIKENQRNKIITCSKLRTSTKTLVLKTKYQILLLSRFALESEEDDFRKNFHSTKDALFKTSAIPTVANLDKNQFTVGYHWDPVRHVSDLKIASIMFPKNLLKNANCLDYIQVS